MWYTIAQLLQLDDSMQVLGLNREDIETAIIAWLARSNSYAALGFRHLSRDTLEDIAEIAEEINDIPTKELVESYWIIARNPDEKHLYGFIKHNANHPSLANIISATGTNKQEDTYWTRSKIRGTIEEWYKTELKISIANEQGARGIADSLVPRFKELSKQLAHMMTEAVTRWFDFHESYYQASKMVNMSDEEAEKLPNDGFRRVRLVAINLAEVIKKMSVEDPDPAAISVSLNACHNSGNILEYIPEYEGRPTGHTSRCDLAGMKDFLDTMSDDAVVPDAEKEINHMQINDLYPKEEHSPEWTRAAFRWYK